MTTHVQHLNHLVNGLKSQYEDRIEYLKDKIQTQQNEISDLNILIDLLSKDKIYDC